VTEDLRHDPDVYAQLDQHGGGCVPSVEYAGISDAGQRTHMLMSGRACKHAV
jgi:hypothetical protein